MTLPGVKNFNRRGGQLSVWGAQRMEGRLVAGITPEGFSWGYEPCVRLGEQVVIHRGTN